MLSEEILDSLSRSDKGVLSGGNRFLFAPQWPAFEDRPGFWDEAHVYNYPLSPLFTYAVLDEDHVEIPLSFVSRTWRPDRLEKAFATGNHLGITERSAMSPGDTLGTVLEIRNDGPQARTIQLIVWTCQPGDTSVLTHGNEGLAFRRDLRIREQPIYPVTCRIAAQRPANSAAVILSQGEMLPPKWSYTPFYDSFNGRLPDSSRPLTPDPDGLIFAGLHFSLEIEPGNMAELPVEFGVTIGDASGEMVRDTARSGGRPLEESSAAWRDYFDSIPVFECSSPFFGQYYRYRWFGLRMNRVEGGEDNYPFPAICEGPSYFRAPISYSAQCHILETRWMKDPRTARGSLLNFIHNQQPDGRFTGYLAPRSLPDEFFYHANWGVIQDLEHIHPDDEFLRQAYAGLSKYVAYFDRERDPDGTGLYDIHNHYETGQEYMHRYLVVDEDADRQHWGSVFRLTGIDVSVYLYETKQALARIALHLDLAEESENWAHSAERTGNAILARMWDPRVGMFSDIDPLTGNRTGVKAAVCFYPYFTDLVDESHLPGLKQHLFNPAEFWTEWPVPSSSVDDPYFDADGRWKHQRMNCPWNGRVWPMTNSHIAEALARTAIRFGDDELRSRTSTFISKFVEMMFFDGDPHRPNTFEHYHPFDGTPSVYRGIDDYQHSWVVDLIIKYVCGIRPSADRVIVDPFPFDIDHFSIDHVVIRGRNIRVERSEETFSVWLDGAPAGSSSLGRHIELSL